MASGFVAFDQIAVEVYYALPIDQKLKFQQNVRTIMTNSVKYLKHLDDIKASDAVYNSAYKAFNRLLDILVDTYMELLFDSFSTTDEQHECPICYEDKQCVVVPKCGHHFCKSCLLKEYDNKNCCPMCREPIIQPNK
jgi:hypothetical protein